MNSKETMSKNNNKTDSNAPDGWKRKELWKKVGENFLVEVSRHEVDKLYEDDMSGRQRWCVYAYIYPEHPYFPAFEGVKEMWEDACCALQLHGGPTFYHVHRDNSGKVTSYQVGADYNHLYDNCYTHYSTAKEAWSVFEDAEALFEQLTRISHNTGEQ